MSLDQNLQKFCQKVSIIVALQTSGKISAQDAFKQIEEFWEVEGLLEALNSNIRQDVVEGFQVECELADTYLEN